MKKDKDTKIEVTDVIKTPGGGAEIILELGDEALRLILQKAIVTLLEEYISEEV